MSDSDELAELRAYLKADNAFMAGLVYGINLGRAGDTAAEVSAVMRASDHTVASLKALRAAKGQSQ